jgi:hypothetical protein
MSENIIEKIDEKIDILTSKPIIAILLLFLIGFTLRIYFTPFELPSRSSDAFFFIIHALSFPNALDYIGGTYFIWSGLLAIIFLPFQFDNYEGYFTIVRITSILISSISSVVLFFIAKEIMSKKYAIFTMALFVLEPNIIENAIFGLTEPLFILLGLISVYFLFQKNPKLLPLAFIFAAFAADTRPTGLILLPTLIIGVYFRNPVKKEFFKYAIIGIVLFGIVYMPMIIHDEGKLPNTSLLNITSQSESFSAEQVKFLDNKFLVSAIIEITHIFRISLPYLIFFAPIGFFVSLQNFNWKIKIMTLIIIFQFIIAIPQYTVSVEFRNLFFLIPIFSLFGGLGIEYFSKDKKLRNVLLLLLTFGLILTSFYFLTERQPDSDLTLEKERFGKFVSSEIEGTVTTASDWNFIRHNIKYSTELIDPSNPFREIEGEIKLYVPDVIIDDEKELFDYLSKHKINYLIVDDKQSKRFKMAQEIYFNEKKFIFLKNVFNSDDFDYKNYRVKIFEIDHTKLE